MFIICQTINVERCTFFSRSKIKILTNGQRRIEHPGKAEMVIDLRLVSPYAGLLGPAVPSELESGNTEAAGVCQEGTGELELQTAEQQV